MKKIRLILALVFLMFLAVVCVVPNAIAEEGKNNSGGVDLTIQLWFKLEEVLTANWFSFVSKDGLPSERSYISAVRKFSNPNSSIYTDRIILRVSDDGTNLSGGEVDLGTDLNVGQWYPLSITYDASDGSSEIFLDRVSKGTISGFDNSIYNGTGTFFIGGNSATNDSFHGKMDDIRVWNRILTLAEIQANTNKELIGNEPGLVGYWPFDDEELRDFGPNGNDLMEVNSPEFSSDVPF